MSNFYVGQKVVSLRTWPWMNGGKLTQDGPIRGEVLVVRSIESSKLTDVLFLGFNKFQPLMYYSGEFRPLEECDQSEDLTRELATQLLERIVHEELDIIPNKQHA
jgi:hypothetical protein